MFVQSRQGFWSSAPQTRLHNCLSDIKPRIYLRRLLLVLGPWSAFDLLFLIERCDLFTILWWNLIFITVTLSRVTVTKLLPINSKSYKTVLLESWPPLPLIPVLDTFFKCWIGESLNLSARYKKLAWCINLFMGSLLIIFDLDLSNVAPLLAILFATLKINLLSPFPAPIFLKTVSGIVVRCYGTVYQLTCGRQDL